MSTATRATRCPGRRRRSAVGSAGADAATASAPLVEVLALATREAESARDPGRAADLWARIALLAWDLGDTDAAVNAARRAQEHPVAARLIVGHALAVPTAQHLDQAEAAARVTPGWTAELAVEIAEARLYRAGDAASAAIALADASDEAARALRPLALAVGGAYEELVRLLDREDATHAELIEGAHVAADRMGDARRAAALLTRARVAAPDDPYALETLIELAAGGNSGLELANLLREKLDGFGIDADAAEQQATRYLLAETLERGGKLADAAAELAPLAFESNSPAAGTWGPRLATHVKRRIALRQRAWDDAAETARALAVRAHPRQAAAWLRRAAQLYDARVGDLEKAAALYAELLSADPGDTAAARALERLRLRGRGRREAGELVAQLERQARAESAPTSLRVALLRRAAAVAESRLGDLDAAVRLRREALAGTADPGSLEELARLHRRQGDRPRLAWAYRQAAGIATDERLASAYLTAAGAVEVGLGQTREAEAALREAVVRAPADVVARLLLAVLFRSAGRWRELAELMDGVAGLAGHDALRAASLRELGRITATRLGDPRGARAHLERALELAPEDAGILEALAVLVGDTGDWAQAVSLRERAVAMVRRLDPGRAAGLLLEIGDIEEHQRKDDDAARAAYERALDLDESSPAEGDPARLERRSQALRALAAQHRKGKRSGDLLRVLRRELTLTSEPQRRLTLLLEIARNADQVEGDVASALETYRAALAIDPANSPALAGLERICRRDGRWELLAEALRAAPRTPRNLRTLGEALEKLERWGELAEVRRQEMEGSAVDRKDAARAAMALAQLLERSSPTSTGAARVYRRAYELEPTDVRPLRALGRLLEARSSWPELVDVPRERARCHGRPAAGRPHAPLGADGGR
jgi:tetratricopeptide (TPR) repeat protein